MCRFRDEVVYNLYRTTSLYLKNKIQTRKRVPDTVDHTALTPQHDLGYTDHIYIRDLSALEYPDHRMGI